MEERINPPLFLYMKLGNLEIKGKVVLAPMAGITSLGYREFMGKFHPALFVTEMVSDMGIIYQNKETLSYISFPKSEIPTGVQLFGNNPENLAKALLICEKTNQNIDFYDVNMGCPVNKVTKTGAGSALLKNPKLCGDIIRALKKVTNKPVTAKIRIGWDSNSINFLEVIKELESAGVDMIGIHARTTKQLYAGEPQYELLRDLRKKMNVPLAISGNIFSLSDAKKAMEITGADMVMVARGGVGNPTLIEEINKDEVIDSTLVEQINYCKDLAKFYIKEKGEEVAMRIYRGIAPKFLSSFPRVKKVKTRLAMELHTYEDLEKILNEYLLENTEGI